MGEGCIIKSFFWCVCCACVGACVVFCRCVVCTKVDVVAPVLCCVV